MRVNKKKLVTVMVERELNDLKMAELAGVSRLTIAGVRNGRDCKPETLSKLSKALNVPVEELVDWEV